MPALGESRENPAGRGGSPSSWGLSLCTPLSNSGDRLPATLRGSASPGHCWGSGLEDLRGPHPLGRTPHVPLVVAAVALGTHFTVFSAPSLPAASQP